MAESIDIIYNRIVNKYVADCATVGIIVPDPATWRLVSRRRIWAYTQAYCIWLLQMMFDQFKADVDEIISLRVPHSPRWYVEDLAKNFQYGFNLIPGKDKYNNTGIADDLIKASKIIAFAAFVEEPFVRLKVAKLNGTSLAKLSDPELTAFRYYISKTKDAGVKLKDATITSNDPDQLKLSVRVKINPLVLDINGRIVNTLTTPVPDAIRSYLQNINFNGKFSVQELEDYIRRVPGVGDLHIDQISTRYGLLPFTSVDIDFVPDSGFLVIAPADLQITYLAA